MRFLLTPILLVSYAGLAVVGDAPQEVTLRVGETFNASFHLEEECDAQTITWTYRYSTDLVKAIAVSKGGNEIPGSISFTTQNLGANVSTAVVTWTSPSDVTVPPNVAVGVVTFEALKRTTAPVRLPISALAIDGEVITVTAEMNPDTLTILRKLPKCIFRLWR